MANTVRLRCEAMGSDKVAHKSIFWMTCLGLFSAVATAQVTSSVGVGVGHSDNIRRTSDNQQNETIGSLDFDLSWLQDSQGLRANVLADIAYLRYFRDNYDPELTGNINALTSFRIVPGRFEWVVADNFGQVRSDPFAPTTPDNRENVNYFTTGPDFNLRLGSAMSARLSGRYSRSDYETSPADSNRYGATASLIRGFSIASNVSLNLSSEKIDYAQPVAADYERREGYIGYALAGARTKATIDAGVMEIRSEGNNRSGVLARLDVSRRLTPSTTLTLRGGREFTDGADAFRLEQGISGPSVESMTTSQNSMPFINKYAGLGWEFANGRTNAGVSATRYSEDHDEASASPDRVRWIAEAHAVRQMRRFLSLRVGVSYLKYEDQAGSVNTVSSFSDTGGTVALAWRATRRLSTDLEYQYFTSGSEYNENRIWLRVIYSLRAGAAGAVR